MEEEKRDKEGKVKLNCDPGKVHQLEPAGELWSISTAQHCPPQR